MFSRSCRKLIKTVLLSLLFSFVLISCDAGRSTLYQGGLYFAQGSYLMRLSLRDGSLSVEGHMGDTVLREISAYGEDHLLIAESASVNRRRVQRISWVDLDTGETADLYAGTRARFLPGGNVVAYDNGLELYAVPQINGSPNEVIFTHGQNQLTSMNIASDDTLLFEADDSDGSLIYSWNANSKDLTPLPGLTAVCRLQGSVWIDSVNRLACKSTVGLVAEAKYILSDLEGNVKGELELPTDGEFLALAYIESQDALVMQETVEAILGSKNQYVVWIVDILSGESHKVPGNINLGNSVVYAAY